MALASWVKFYLERVEREQRVEEKGRCDIFKIGKKIADEKEKW